MRVHHLLETVDYSPLVKVWQSGVMNNLVDLFAQEEGDEAKLLSILLSKAQAQADAHPEKLFSLIEPIIDVIATLKSAPSWYQEVWLGVLHEFVRTVLQMDRAALKLLGGKMDLNKLAKLIDSKLAMQLKLAVEEASRTKAQEKFDKQNQQYVFIGRPAFKEEPDGKYRKTLEIEKLVPVDRFDIKTHQMVEMMKLRARYQGENSDVYMVTLPVTALKPGADVPEWMIDLIDEHKTRVT